jgi:alkyl hydroperoxide reductase subunit AhpC
MMTENSILQVGDTVPDFSLTTYEPTTKGFGEYKLGEAMKNGKWTMLFFYPADYTFV